MINEICKNISTEAEYFRKLDKIEKEVSHGNYQTAIDQLEKLYLVKPVRLRWFVLRSYCEFKIGRNEEADRIIGEKYAYMHLYPGIEECTDFFAERYASDISLSESHLIMKQILQGKDVQRYKDAYKDSIIRFLNDFSNTELLDEVYRNAVRNNDYFMSRLLEYYIYKADSNITTNVKKCYPAYAYLYEKLETPGSTFVIVNDKENAGKTDLILRVLKEYQQNLYVIIDSMEMTVENEIDWDGIVQISLENIQYAEGVAWIPTIVLNGRNNMDLLIRNIVERQCEKKLVMVIANGNCLDELKQQNRLNIQQLMPFTNSFCDKNFKIAWAGDYYSYLTDVYNYNVEEDVRNEVQYDFSIIVPARNSSKTLEYTLQSCLNQDYEGTYEIVVSDNSTDGNASVYQLIQQINDSRINYFKTPRNLPLTKSFEYAYLKSRGKYLLSIGSDDGILPWALSTLAEVWNQYPNENIIQWERGFYAWPGFNGGQENELIIPNQYAKGNYQAHYVESIDYIARTVKFPNNMYSLPNLYINSAFKRTYIKELKEKTGRLWDGNNQDVSMGITNIFLNKRILNIKYPLTIAGMSDGSLGAITNVVRLGNVSNYDVMQILGSGENIVVYIPSKEERILPVGVLSDANSLYCNFLRGVSNGIVPREYIGTVLNFKDMYIKIFSQLSIYDDKYDKYLQIGRYCAQQIGEDFLHWYEQTIYEPCMKPSFRPEQNQEDTKKEKSYVEGPTEAGGMIYDASKYDVSNIAEAVLLFAKLSGLARK